MEEFEQNIFTNLRFVRLQILFKRKRQILIDPWLVLIFHWCYEIHHTGKSYFVKMIHTNFFGSISNDIQNLNSFI